MSKTKMAIFGLLAVTFVAVNGMDDSQNDTTAGMTKYDDKFYQNLYWSINVGKPYQFMQVINEMDAQGHALDQEAYDALKAYAEEQEFDRFDIVENNIYQKMSAAVLKDDVSNFTDHLLGMTNQCVSLTNDHVYWLLDLAIRAKSSNAEAILAEELASRGLHFEGPSIGY